MASNKHALTNTESFHAKYEEVPECGCWLWTAAIDKRGYGKFNARRGDDVGIAFAHRVSWELHNGPIPEGMHVCHRCDTPSCVNPGHLFLGTQADNMLDMTMKGRRATGEAAGPARITRELALEVLMAEGTHQSIADRLGLVRQHVGKIKSGIIWKELHHG